MKKENKQLPNNLDLYRRRMTVSQERLIRLLGHDDSAMWSDWERGKHLPSLANALRLGIIFRIPLEFLFYALHDELRAQIRAEEERLDQPIQQPLF